MQKWWKTSSGTIRWYCPRCHVTTVRTRTDIKITHWKNIFKQWILSKRSLADMAWICKCSRDTLEEHFQQIWASITVPRGAISVPSWAVVIVDGFFYHHRSHNVLIARTIESPCIGFAFTSHESEVTWDELFWRCTEAPKAIVCDGRAGLLRSARKHFPGCTIQRCLVHIQQGIRRATTTRPKYSCWKELYELSKQVMSIRTHTEAQIWKERFFIWSILSDAYLAQKTHVSDEIFDARTRRRKRWWYTHKNLRWARFLLTKAIPDMFHYLDDPEIPSHTNHLEWGINARLAELLRCHRWQNVERKQKMITLMLREKMSSKSSQKPTQTPT